VWWGVLFVVFWVLGVCFGLAYVLIFVALDEQTLIKRPSERHRTLQISTAAK
jgi:hypothetical protein